MSTAPEFTVENANHFLKQAGFHCSLAEGDFQRTVHIAPIGQFFNALRLASTDTGAKAYVQNILTKLNVAYGAVAGDDSAPANDPGHPTDNQSESDTGPRVYVHHHVYGKKAAVEFSADTTKAKSNKPGRPTVAIEAAFASQGAERSYNWKDGIRIQLTLQELPIVAAVLLGYINKAEFTQRGSSGKGFVLERSENKILTKVLQSGGGNTMRVVPITGSDIFYVTAIVIGQLQKTIPDVGEGLLFGMLRSMVQIGNGSQ